MADSVQCLIIAKNLIPSHCKSMRVILTSTFVFACLHSLATASPQPDEWIPKPLIDASFFNNKDLTGWKGNDGYWSVEDGAIVGHSDKSVPDNEYIWSGVIVTDFPQESDSPKP